MEGLILDFDGVIADSEPAHERAIREVALSVGLSMSHELYETRIIGLSDRDTFRVIAEDAGQSLDDPGLDRLCEQKHALFLDLVERGEVRLFPGTLEIAREASGSIPLGICSGASRMEIEAILAQAGIRDLFSVIVTADEVSRAKPDPEGYALAARELGVPAMRCVSIEDTDKGIAAAKAAGLRVLGVCHSLPEERLTQADAVIRSTEGLTLAQLRSLIGG